MIEPISAILDPCAAGHGRGQRTSGFALSFTGEDMEREDDRDLRIRTLTERLFRLSEA